MPNGRVHLHAVPAKGTVTGSGILWAAAGAELQRFVEATGISFYTTPQGRGAVPEDHPRAFPAARSMAFREADVVLVIGARANSMLSFLRAPRFSADAKFINVNLDGTEIGHNRGVDIGIVGDAKLVLQQLTEEAAGKIDGSQETEWIAQLSAKQHSNEERSAPLLHSDAVPVHPLRLCKEVREIITLDTILVVDGHQSCQSLLPSAAGGRAWHRHASQRTPSSSTST